MIWIDIAVGAVISVLCGMGIGGGGLYVIYLTLIRNVSQINAQGTNLAFFIASSVFALILHIKKGRLDYKITAPIAYIGTMFSLFGAAAADALSNNIIRKCFGGVLVLGALIGLFQKSGNKKKENKKSIPIAKP